MIDPHELQQDISEAYLTSGNVIGWRLLYSPEMVLKNADVAFLGLNPGGTSHPTNHAEFCTDAGSAYLTESWYDCSPGTSVLQRQVLGLFDKLGVKPAEVLAGNLVPWRSRSWQTLANKSEAVAFGKQLWTRILGSARPDLIVTMGRETGIHVTDILGVKNLEKVPLGWGSISAAFGSTMNQRLVCLPHLSRFQIVTRARSQEALHKLFAM